MLELDWWLARLRWLGLAAIVICIVTWAVDMTGMVYECPYCRTQRTVIGLLGLLAMLPNPGHWIIRFVAGVIGGYGFHVAAAQHFMNWRKIMDGEFTFGERWYINAWMLSGFAMFIIAGLVLAIWLWRARSKAAVA